MLMISGLHNLGLYDNLIWVIPHENHAVGTIDYYENPCVHGAFSLVDVEEYVYKARRSGMRCRIMDNVYEQQLWHTATFDYHEIDLSAWPALDVKPSKRRNEFRKISERAHDLNLGVREITTEEFLTLVPLLPWDDSAASSIIPMLLSSDDTRHGEFAGVLFTVGYYRGDQCVGLSILCHRDDMIFNLSLIRIDPEITASDLTWALCNWTKAQGVRYLDLWNVALTQREGYKRSFFTGTRQAFCYASADLVMDTPWLHPIVHPEFTVIVHNPPLKREPDTCK